MEVEEKLQPAKEEVVTLIQETLANKEFAYRGDYTQFMKLVLVALTGDTTNFKLPRPGALSKARWMGKTIYAISMFLLKSKIANELGKDAVIMTPRQVVRFVRFVCLVYAKWWIRCPLPAECGLVDLELLRAIRSFPDEVIALAAERAFLGHL